MTGSSGGSSGNSVQNTSGPPPSVLASYDKLTGGATNLSQQPLRQYDGPMVAGFSPDQQRGFSTIDNAAGIGTPYINSAAGYFGAATTPLWPTLPQYTAGNVNQYLSPYTQDVTDALTGLYNHQNEQQQSQITGNAAMHGAFGGDREAAVQAMTAGEQQRAQAPTLAQVQQQGFQGAQSEFNAEKQQQLAAEQANAWLNSQAGFGVAGLGTEAQNQALTGANALLGSGGMQQKLAQEQLNIPYQKFLQQQAYPYQQLGFLSPIVEGTGSLSGGTGKTTYPGPSTLSQVGGLGLAGLGLYGLGSQQGWWGGSGSSFGNVASDGIANPIGDAGMTGLDSLGFPTGAKQGGRIGYAEGGGAFGIPEVPGVGAGIPVIDLSYIPQAAPGGIPSPGLSPFQPVTTSTSSGGGGGGGSALGDLSSVAGIIGTGLKIASFFDRGGRVGDPWRPANESGPAYDPDRVMPLRPFLPLGTAGKVLGPSDRPLAPDYPANDRASGGRVGFAEGGSSSGGIGGAYDLPVIPAINLDYISHPGPAVKGAGPPKAPSMPQGQDKGLMGDVSGLLSGAKELKGLGVFGESAGSEHAAAGGGIGHYAMGGASIPLSAAIQSGGAPPSQTQSMQQLLELPMDRLQQMAVQFPPTSSQGQLVQRALQQKRMTPGAGTAPVAGGFGAPTQGGGFGAGSAPQQATGYADGGGVPGYVTEDELDPYPVIDHSGDTVKVRYPSEGKVLDLGIPSLKRGQFAAGGSAGAEFPHVSVQHGRWDETAGGGPTSPGAGVSNQSVPLLGTADGESVPGTATPFFSTIKGGNGLAVPQLSNALFAPPTDLDPGGGMGNWFQPLSQWEPPGTSTTASGAKSYPSTIAYLPSMAGVISAFGGSVPDWAGGTSGGGGSSIGMTSPITATDLPPVLGGTIDTAIGGDKRGGRIGFDDGGVVASAPIPPRYRDEDYIEPPPQGFVPPRQNASHERERGIGERPVYDGIGRIGYDEGGKVWDTGSDLEPMKSDRVNFPDIGFGPPPGNYVATSNKGPTLKMPGPGTAETLRDAGQSIADYLAKGQKIEPTTQEKHTFDAPFTPRGSEPEKQEYQPPFTPGGPVDSNGVPIGIYNTDKRGLPFPGDAARGIGADNAGLGSAPPNRGGGIGEPAAPEAMTTPDRGPPDRQLTPHGEMVPPGTKTNSRGEAISPSLSTMSPEERDNTRRAEAAIARGDTSQMQRLIPTGPSAEPAPTPEGKAPPEVTSALGGANGIVPARAPGTAAPQTLASGEPTPPSAAPTKGPVTPALVQQAGYTNDPAGYADLANYLWRGEASDFNVLYGGKRFASFDQHPADKGWQGGYGPAGPTHAAGLPQFQPGTWHGQAQKLGLTDFSPPSQVKGGLDLAETVYRQQTGGDLLADFKAGKLDKINSALHSTWTSLGSGQVAGDGQGGGQGGSPSGAPDEVVQSGPGIDAPLQKASAIAETALAHTPAEHRGPMQEWMRSPYFLAFLAGAGMLASKSPFPGVALGEGMQFAAKGAETMAGQQNQQEVAAIRAQHLNDLTAVRAQSAAERASNNHAMMDYRLQNLQRQQQQGQDSLELRRQIAAAAASRDQAALDVKQANLELAGAKVQLGQYNAPVYGEGPSDPKDPNSAKTSGLWYAPKVPDPDKPFGGGMFIPGAGAPKAATGERAIYQDLVHSGEAVDEADAIKKVAAWKADPHAFQQSQGFSRLVQAEVTRLSGMPQNYGKPPNSFEAQARKTVMDRLQSAPGAASAAAPSTAAAPATPSAPAAPPATQPQEVIQNGWRYRMQNGQYTPIGPVP